MGDDGRRSGEVILALLLQESEIVQARVQLHARDYEKASKAHMMPGVYVKITGKLQPGRQPRTLIDMVSFDPFS